MAKTKLQGLKRIEELKAALPSATTTASPTKSRRTSKGEGTGLMLMVPADTLKALRRRAADEGTTVRALVLEELRKGGYPVPADELIDRRRQRA